MNTRKRPPAVRRSKTERLQLKRKMVDMLGGKCVDCGYSEHLAALDFDHKDPKTKKDTVSNYLTSYSESMIFLEALKCELRCANCHRIKTHPDAHM